MLSVVEKVYVRGDGDFIPLITRHSKDLNNVQPTQVVYRDEM